MDEEFSPPAEIRAKWLAELSNALDEAQMLLSRLNVYRIDHAQAELLKLQIEELRAELWDLQRNGFARE